MDLNEKLDNAQDYRALKAGKDKSKSIMVNGERLLTEHECLEKRVPNFCEENVWHMLKIVQTRLESVREEKVHAVFITNADRCVSFNHQRASLSPTLASSSSSPCLWDYHVIVLIEDWVYDIDSTLPFPTPLKDYMRLSFSPSCDYYFRVVSIVDFFGLFSSDRRHMQTIPQNMEACIKAESHSFRHTLPLFLNVPGLDKERDLLSLSRKEEDCIINSLKGRTIGTLIKGTELLQNAFKVDLIL